MKTPTNQVYDAVQLYYQGLSLPTICRQLREKYNNFASISTVYDWVVKYSRIVMTATREFHPIVGDIWFAEETTINTLGGQLWVWDIIDEQTLFLLASKVSINRAEQEFQTVLECACSKALKTPRNIVAEDLDSFLNRSEYLVALNYSINELECFHRFQCVLEGRTKLVGDLKRFDKVVEFIDGWLVHYNYFRPQVTLGGKVPSETANLIYASKAKKRIRTN